MLLEALLIMVTSSQWKQTLNKGPPDTMPKQQLSFVVFFEDFSGHFQSFAGYSYGCLERPDY